jgi:hypothetical protein
MERINGRRKRARKTIEMEYLSEQFVDLDQKNKNLQTENEEIKKRIELMRQWMTKGGGLACKGTGLGAYSSSKNSLSSPRLAKLGQQQVVRPANKLDEALAHESMPHFVASAQQMNLRGAVPASPPKRGLPSFTVPHVEGRQTRPQPSPPHHLSGLLPFTPATLLPLIPGSFFSAFPHEGQQIPHSTGTELPGHNSLQQHVQQTQYRLLLQQQVVEMQSNRAAYRLTMDMLARQRDCQR